MTPSPATRRTRAWWSPRRASRSTRAAPRSPPGSDPHDRVRVALATRPGHFGRATTLASGLRPSPAIAADGTVTVVWEGAHDKLRFARTSHGRFGPARTLAAGGSATVAAQPDGSSVVVFEAGAYISTATISASGQPGAAVRLGKGGFDHDSVRAAADGTLAACCITPVNTDPNVPPDTAPKVAVYRPVGGWRLISQVGGDEIATVFANASALVTGSVDVVTGGDAGVLGAPGIARAGADDVLGPPVRPAVAKPGRALAPDVTIDGSGRSVIVYQEKTRSQAFHREAPVYASIGSRQRLDSRQAYQPTVRPLGPGAIAVWQAPGARWGVAVERDGRFKRVAGPSGAGPQMHLGEDFNYAYGFATNGGFAVLTWVAADGSIRVSELR